MSSRAADDPGRVPQDGEDLASNVAFEATDDLTLAHSLSGAATHVLLGPVIVSEPDDGDAMECCIGLAVASAVQPVPVGLAGGRRYRTHAAPVAQYLGAIDNRPTTT